MLYAIATCSPVGWVGEPKPPPWLRPALTPAQREIAALLLSGYTAREIGALTSRSPRTVETHVEQMKLRLACRSRAALLVALLRLGVEPRPNSGPSPSR